MKKKLLPLASQTGSVSPKPVGFKKSPASSEPRLVARASQDVVDLIKNAADLAGVSLSQFLTDSAVKSAEKVIAEKQQIHLSVESANMVFAAIENPPAPNSHLLAAAARFEERRNGSFRK